MHLNFKMEGENERWLGNLVFYSKSVCQRIMFARYFSSTSTSEQLDANWTSLPTTSANKTVK